MKWLPLAFALVGSPVAAQSLPPIPAEQFDVPTNLYVGGHCASFYVGGYQFGIDITTLEGLARWGLVRDRAAAGEKIWVDVIGPAGYTSEPAHPNASVAPYVQCGGAQNMVFFLPSANKLW